MRYRRLGDTDITCSEIGFGVWTVTAGWWGDYSDDEAIRLLRKAYDQGVTFFDTAPTYGADRRGETIVARALGDVRDRVVYSTKVGYDVEADWAYEGHRERPHRSDPAYIRETVDRSLRALDTDVIDVLTFHNPRMDHVVDDDLWDALAGLKAEGKVRAYGPSIGPKIGWREEGLAALARRPEADAFMIIHNLLEQDPGRDFLSAARGTGTGFTVRVPHSSGLLEGKYTLETTFDENDHRAHRKREWLTEGLKKVEKLDFLTGEMTIGQAALKWLLAEPQIATVLPNIYGEAQIEEFCAVGDLRDLTADEVAAVNDLYDRNFDLVTAS